VGTDENNQSVYSDDPQAPPLSTISDPSHNRMSRSGRPKEVRIVVGLDIGRGLPPFGDRKVNFAERGWTARAALGFWGERCRVCDCEDCLSQKNFWFKLGLDWGWDSRWSLDYKEKDMFWETFEDPFAFVFIPVSPFYGTQTFQFR